MNTFAIETKNLTRTFGQTRAVDEINLEVPAGIVFGFLGPNGAGKTTTIRLLLGLLAPDSGSAAVLGFDTRTQSDEIRTRCGALLEHSGLYERLSAEDNLEFYGRVWRIPAAERQTRIRELLEPLGLYERRKEVAGTWSRGMKQKLAIARALLHHPSLLFLDEPTSGLDPVAAVALREELADLAEREGVTVFLNTHNLSEAEKLCHRVGIIRDGRLLAVGPLDELRARAGGPRLEVHGNGFTRQAVDALRERPEVSGVNHRNGLLTITLKDTVETAPLVNLLVASGAEIEEVRKDKASLEEAFLTLMEKE